MDGSRQMVTCTHCTCSRLSSVRLKCPPHQFGTGEPGRPITVFFLPQGYIASRLLSRRACYILKMDHKAIPALDKLERYIYEKQVILQYSSPFPIPLPGKMGAYRGKKRVRGKIIILHLTMIMHSPSLKVFSPLLILLSLISTIQPPI